MAPASALLRGMPEKEAKVNASTRPLRFLRSATLAASFASPVLASALLGGCASTPAPENIHFTKQRLTEYYVSGRYEADVARVAAEASAYLKGRILPGSKAAVVFDIDETTLSNFPALRANDHGWIIGGPCTRDAQGQPSTPCGLGAWIQQGVSAPIEPIHEVYRVARAMGVAVFFVTGRPDTPEMRAATECNLRAAGYAEWAGLALKPAKERMTTIEFKSAERRKIVEQGYTVVASIGDQRSDPEGGYAERLFLVPNPFYFIP
jgi:acid phosphatase